MGRWSNEAKVGMLILVSLMLLAFLILNSASWTISRGGQKLKVRFRSVGTLTMKAPVHLSGVKVGEVSKIQLIEDKVEVTLGVKNRVDIRRGGTVTIGTLGLVGETYIDVKNGPLGNPKLLPNEIIEGVEPLNSSELTLKVNQFITASAEILSSVQKFVKSNESELQSVASELKNTISDLNSSAKQTLSNVDRLTMSLNEAVRENDKMLNRTLTRLNSVLDRVNLDSEELSDRLREILSELNDFLQEDRSKVEAIIEQIAQLSKSLYSTSTQLNSDLKQLNLTASNVLKQFDQLSQSETPKIQEGLSRFVNSSKDIEEIIKSLKGIIAKLEDKNGSVGRLINDGHLINDVDQTLYQARSTMSQVEKLSENLNENLKKINQLSPSFDYELRYRTGVRDNGAKDGAEDRSRSLHNEFGFSILPLNSSKLRIGLSSRESQLNYELQAALSFALGRLWARAGLIRSKIGAGMDYWLIRDKLGLSLEAVDITSSDKRPEIDFEAIFKTNLHWNMILGAEDITDPKKAGLAVGIKATY